MHQEIHGLSHLEMFDLYLEITEMMRGFFLVLENKKNLEKVQIDEILSDLYPEILLMFFQSFRISSCYR